jgi:predicted nucleic acid-binding protein
MPAPDFLATNVLLYAYDPSDRKKQRIAMELPRKALAGHMVVSTQVLAEFSAALLHEISPPAPTKHLKVVLNALAPIRLIVPDGDMVRRAVEAHAQYGVHFYDAMIVAAAERGGCQRIWSEDLNAGQHYFGIVVENPFPDTDL